MFAAVVLAFVPVRLTVHRQEPEVEAGLPLKNIVFGIRKSANMFSLKSYTASPDVCHGDAFAINNLLGYCTATMMNWFPLFVLCKGPEKATKNVFNSPTTA